LKIDLSHAKLLASHEHVFRHFESLLLDQHLSTTMKLLLLASLSAALSLASLALAKASETSAVLDLTKTSDFDKAIGKGTPALVEFFAPWCGHCKKLAPTFEELASAYAGKKQSVIIAKVDADANRELGQRFGVQGFPTLMWFKANDVSKPETYSGPRDLNGMKNYIQEMSGAVGQVKPPPPSPVTQLTASNFDSIVNDPKKDAFVEFYAPWCGHCKNLAPIWDQLAETFQNEPNCVIGQMDADNPANKEVAAKYGVSGFPTLSVSAMLARLLIPY
jgi:protein disulfide-isomerase A6